MTTEDELALRTTLERLIDRDPLSEAASAGLNEVIDKVEPLLAGGRLNRVVELLSVLADVVDLADTHMIEHSMKVFEEAVDGYWSVSNAARMAGNEVIHMKEPPSLLGLLRMAGKPEVRRGLAFILATAGVLGRGRLAHDSVDPVGA